MTNPTPTMREALEDIIAAADAGILRDLAADRDFAESRQIKNALAALAAEQEDETPAQEIARLQREIGERQARLSFLVLGDPIYGVVFPGPSPIQKDGQ